MAELSIAKSLNKAYRHISIDKVSFDEFKSQLTTLFEQIASVDTEEKVKGDLMDFLKLTFYRQNYKVSPNGKIDAAIHLGSSIDAPVGVIFEVKMPSNVTEMVTRENLNRKALQEILLYYLRERVEKKNIQLKQLVITNIYEFFIFDAQEFERVFYSNKKLLKAFDDFNNGKLTSDKTDFFYKEIAAAYIENVVSDLNYTYFDIRDYRRFLNNGNDKKLIELYKVFSPEHLLKKSFQIDSNKLNTKFYSELLYIIGLEEVEDKDSHKRIITRCKESERKSASILENAITILDSEDCVDDVKNRAAYGKTREEQLFNIALSLTIGWVNRVLFLKLLEAQLVKYHKGDTSYSFLKPAIIPDYDELNKFFFQVLAKRPEDRTESISEKFGRIPYLNSSLFEVSPLERQTIRISGLENGKMPLFGATVLKDGGKPKYKELSTLHYLLEFLDAYDFASEGEEDIQEESRTLINASVLGLIFEKINGHRDGSVFTPGAITMYMSRNAVRQTIVRRFNEEFGWSCKDYEALKDKDIEDLATANKVVDSIKICDPAVGSGHFLVSVLNEFICTKYDLGILLDCNGKRIKKQDYSIDIENDELIISDEDGAPFNYVPANPESQRIQEALFNEKKKIIENCLFGVDLNPNAVNICRLRLWIELLKNAYYTKDSEYTELETLPNIDINIKVGNSLLHRFDLNQDISEILKKSNLTISGYQEAVSRYKNAHSKEEKRELDDMIAQIKSNLKTQISMRDPKLVKLQNMQSELSSLEAPLLFEISKKEKAKNEKTIKELKLKISKAQKGLDEIRNNKIFIGAFEWRIEFPEVLDEDGRFTGFDCVIGNPPYIQLQKMGADADALQKMNYETYERTGDIYCLFYEMGMKLLKPEALLTFITSNGWMKSAYGKSLRSILTSQYQPSLLVDFAGYKVFDSATVDVNILSVIKSNVQKETTACSIRKDDFEVDKLSDYVQTNCMQCSFGTESWSILSDIERSIKQKVETVGVPLREWDVQIYRGVLTGYNDAFIISSDKRDEILSKCADEEERTRTAELIRPILRGRDVRRYGYDWANLWLINTHNGIRGELERIHIEDFPAIKRHLDNYWDKIEPRADQGDTAYNLRNCAYLDEFSQPKIIWKRVGSIIRFSYDEKGVLGLDSTCFATGTHIPYLCCVLNSSMGHYLLNNAPRTGTGDLLISVQAVEPVRIPLVSENEEIFIELVNRAISDSSNNIDDEIDNIIFDLYGLNPEEREFIINNFR